MFKSPDVISAVLLTKDNPYVLGTVGFQTFAVMNIHVML